MRLLVDAIPLLVRSAGVKNYLYHWIESLRLAAGPGESIRTFPVIDSSRSLDHDRSVAGFWRTKSALAALAANNYTAAPVMDWVGRDADIFHASSLTSKVPRHAHLTATVHDLTSWMMPELHPASNRRADENLASLARRAHRLIAVSECTRQDAIRVWGIAPEKIEVIHSGVADTFFHVEAPAIAAVRARYSLAKPFILCVGTIEPRKNTDGLLAAYHALPASVREEYDLVLAGPIGWADPAAIERAKRVRYLGYVPEADIAPLTAAATVFAYPSLYEGFGFPVAQAMAAGVPVITSNVSSLPEIAGNAAVLIDPRSQDELTNGLNRLLLSPELRQDFAERGRLRAARFQWQACAERSLHFFREVATGERY
jgi:glycosyltransferase involved in cell wall biosynthesis